MERFKIDRNSDDIITPQEQSALVERIRLDNEDKKEDAQRRMVWAALTGMLTFPGVLVTAEYMGMLGSLEALSSIAPTYFVSVSAVVAAYFAKEGYVQSRIDRTSIDITNDPGI